MNLTFRDRQVALGMCVGMSNAQMANALDLAVDTVRGRRKRLLLRSGYRSSVEFAIEQNAAVREEAARA